MQIFPPSLLLREKWGEMFLGTASGGWRDIKTWHGKALVNSQEKRRERETFPPLSESVRHIIRRQTVEKTAEGRMPPAG